MKCGTGSEKKNTTEPKFRGKMRKFRELGGKPKKENVNGLEKNACQRYTLPFVMMYCSEKIREGAAYKERED